MSTFGERLRLILEERKVKPAQLARDVNKPRQTISNYMSNRSFPDNQFFVDLKTALPFISLDWLLVGVGERYSDTTDILKLKQENETLKTREEQFLKTLSMLSSVIPNQTSKESRSFRTGVHVSGLRIHSLIEKYTMACTPLAVETARA